MTTPQQLGTLGQALADAIAYRDVTGLLDRKTPMQPSELAASSSLN